VALGFFRSYPEHYFKRLRPPPSRKKTKKQTKTKQGVCHIVSLPFTLKNILRQKKNYENSNISPCKKYNLQKKILYKKPRSLKILLHTVKDVVVIFREAFHLFIHLIIHPWMASYRGKTLSKKVMPGPGRGPPRF
jgi:hypothetical protein